MIKRQNALMLVGLAVLGVGADLSFQAVFPAVAADKCASSSDRPGDPLPTLPFDRGH